MRRMGVVYAPCVADDPHPCLKSLAMVVISPHQPHQSHALTRPARVLYVVPRLVFVSFPRVQENDWEFPLGEVGVIWAFALYGYNAGTSKHVQNIGKGYTYIEFCKARPRPLLPPSLALPAPPPPPPVAVRPSARALCCRPRYIKQQLAWSATLWR